MLTWLDQLTLIIKKDILVLGKGTTQGFEHTLISEKLYNINFTVSSNKFFWVYIIMVLIVICFLMGLNNLNLKQKIQAL